MKSIIVLLSIAAWTSLAWGDPTPSLVGTYRGKVPKDSAGFLLSLVPFEGENAGYLALLQSHSLDSEGHPEEKGFIYLVEPTEHDSKFTLKPIQVIRDGSVGTTALDPSLTLGLTGESAHGHLSFKLTYNKGPHDLPDEISFSGKDWVSNRIEWIPPTLLLNGRYEMPESRENESTITLDQNTVDGTAHCRIAAAEMSGDYVLRQQWPQIFTFKRSEETGEGAKVLDYPKKLGVFLKQDRKYSLLLIDAGQKHNVIKLEQRH